VSTLRMYHLSAPELHRLEMALLRLTDYGTHVRQSTFTLYTMELVALHHAACPFCALAKQRAEITKLEEAASTSSLCSRSFDRTRRARTESLGADGRGGSSMIVAAAAAAAIMPILPDGARAPVVSVTSRVAQCSRMASAVATGQPLPSASARRTSAAPGGTTGAVAAPPEKPAASESAAPVPRRSATVGRPARPSSLSKVKVTVTKPASSPAKPASRMGAMSSAVSSAFASGRVGLGLGRAGAAPPN